MVGKKLASAPALRFTHYVYVKWVVWVRAQMQKETTESAQRTCKQAYKRDVLLYNDNDVGWMS